MISQAEIERAFALIEEAAIKGDRCPQAPPHGPLSKLAVTVLYATGRVRGEIFAGNWRRMTILTGPNRGKATAGPPFGTGQPYKVIPPMRGMYPERKIAP